MKNLVIIIGLTIIVIVGAIYFRSQNTISTSEKITPTNKIEIPQTSVIAENLDTPWAIAFLPDNSMLVTERDGTVLHDLLPIAKINKVKEIGEGGLLGIAIHPNFSENNYVYLYYTYNNLGDDTLNRVVRMKYLNNTLINEEIIVDNIPGASNHNGGRIKFGPDGFLYIATGDAENPSQAQDTNSLAGKILRVTDEGQVSVFSYGHRNVQGLAWNENGDLWATEHGRSGTLSGLDELNLIESGKNYGWPEIQGDETKSGMETARKNSATTTWAPSGAAFIGDSLYFAGLRGQTLYEAIIQNGQVLEVKEHFKGEFGRIREVIVGPDGMLYITTSNKDGRGNPKSGDDKIIRVNPKKL